MSIKRVFLVGFMGSGKSTLGRLIAKDTSWSFIDLDDYFENKHQTTIANYFELLGEEAFRKAEKETLAEVLNMEKVIVATGGGTPCFYNNMDVMNENGLTLYLKLSPKALVERLKSSKNVRPLVANKSGDELLAFIEDKITERTPHYEKSHVVVDSETLAMDAYTMVLELAGVNFQE